MKPSSMLTRVQCVGRVAFLGLMTTGFPTWAPLPASVSSSYSSEPLHNRISILSSLTLAFTLIFCIF